MALEDDGTDLSADNDLDQTGVDNGQESGQESRQPGDQLVDESADSTPEKPAKNSADKPPPTMEDTIRARLRELNKPAEEKPPAGQVRDPKTGKFVAAPKADDPAAADPNATKQPENAAEKPPAKPEEKGAEAKAVDLNAPPSSWGAAARAEYAKLSPAVRAQVHKREADFHAGIAQYKQDAAVGKEIMTDFQPYMPMLRASNTTPKQLVQAWTNLEYKLYQAPTPEAKAKIILDSLKPYGVSIEHFAGHMQKQEVDASGNPVQPQQVDPKVAELEKRLGDLAAHLEKDKTAQAQIEYTRIEEELNAFRNAPGHEHFEAVRHDMSALMETGRADSLQDAYDKACWANPEVRAILLEQQRVEEANKAAERAAAAKRAAKVNVAPRGTPPAKKAPTPGSGTMEDTIRQALRAINAREGV